ncbi:MAG: cysteine desulfurase [Pseudomonadota bacterium]
MPTSLADKSLAFDPVMAKKDFPVFSEVKPYGQDLVYLDNAASTQKPKIVLDTLNAAYRDSYANVHRGLHYLANKATIAFEDAREKVQKFIGAEDKSEIIWTAGATDGFNMIADSLGADLKAGDEIILSIAEHHSNIVPWHFLRERKGCVIKWLDIDAKGDISLAQLEELITDKTKIISITHMSNILGTINPIQDIAKMIADKDIYLVVDGAQGAVHLPVNVVDLGVDFYVATGHKLYGPTGIGFAYGRKEHLEAMRPYRGGGEMIDQVSRDNVTYGAPPNRFEAGTPQIIQAIGLGAAVDYIMAFGQERLFAHEQELVRYCHQKMTEIGDIEIYGTSDHKGGVVSFNLKGVHPHDVATYIDRKGVAIRAGHHCGQQLMTELGVPATSRASFALYNTCEDIDHLIDALSRAKAFFEVS